MPATCYTWPPGTGRRRGHIVMEPEEVARLYCDWPDKEAVTYRTCRKCGDYAVCGCCTEECNLALCGKCATWVAGRPHCKDGDHWTIEKQIALEMEQTVKKWADRNFANSFLNDMDRKNNAKRDFLSEKFEIRFPFRDGMSSSEWFKW